jgi:hypothetical protein
MINLFIQLLEKIKLYEYEIVDFGSFTELVLRFALNTAMLFLLVRWLYYTSTRRKDYLFTYFSHRNHHIPALLPVGECKNSDGLCTRPFCIFGILRYRTDQIPIKGNDVSFSRCGPFQQLMH